MLIGELIEGALEIHRCLPTHAGSVGIEVTRVSALEDFGSARQFDSPNARDLRR